MKEMKSQILFKWNQYNKVGSTDLVGVLHETNTHSKLTA